VEARPFDLAQNFEVLSIQESSSSGSEAIFAPFEMGAKPISPLVEFPPAQSQVICIASGKGGTGKTTFTTNLSILLQQEGLRVLVVDADFGLANDHLLLGLEPKGDISDVLTGRKDIKEVLLKGPGGITLLPGGVGSSDLSSLEDYDLRTIAREVGSLEPEFDIILFDLAAGVSPQIMRLLRPAHEVLLVTNPEVTAMIDAYGLIKCLGAWNKGREVEVQVIMNRVRTREESIAAMQKLRHTAAKHLDTIKLNYIGYIPFDRYLLHSIAIQKPAVLSHSRSFVTSCLKAIAQKIAARYKNWDKKQNQANPLPSYFSKLEQQSYE